MVEGDWEETQNEGKETALVGFDCWGYPRGIREKGKGRANEKKQKKWKIMSGGPGNLYGRERPREKGGKLFHHSLSPLSHYCLPHSDLPGLWLAAGKITRPLPLIITCKLNESQ